LTDEQQSSRPKSAQPFRVGAAPAPRCVAGSLNRPSYSPRHRLASHPATLPTLLCQPQTWCSKPALCISVMSLSSPVLGFPPVNQWAVRSQHDRNFAARGNVVVRRSVEPSRIDSSNSSKDFPQMVGPRIDSISRGGGFCRRASPDGFLRITDSDRHRLSHGHEI
jgi:hypothetical protein